MNTSKEELAAFAKRLKELLDAKCEGNGSKLARAAGCTPQAVNKWLLGEQFPRSSYLNKIADFLNTTPNYLRFGEGKPQLPPVAPAVILMYVDTQQEAALLTHFREGTDVGKQQLLLSAAMIEKKPAGELPAKDHSALH